MPDHLKPGVDWASTPDGSLFYAAFPVDHLYGTLTWTEPNFASVKFFCRARPDGVEAYMDGKHFTRIITRKEFEAAKDLNWPPLEDVMRHLGHGAEV